MEAVDLISKLTAEGDISIGQWLGRQLMNHPAPEELEGVEVQHLWHKDTTIFVLRKCELELHCTPQRVTVKQLEHKS